RLDHDGPAGVLVDPAERDVAGVEHLEAGGGGHLGDLVDGPAAGPPLGPGGVATGAPSWMDRQRSSRCAARASARTPTTSAADLLSARAPGAAEPRRVTSPIIDPRSPMQRRRRMRGP